MGETQISRYTICLSYTLFPESTLHLNFSRNSHSFTFVPHSVINNVPFSSLKCLYFDNQYIPFFLSKHPVTNTDTDRLQTQIEESYILSYWTKVKFVWSTLYKETFTALEVNLTIRKEANVQGYVLRLFNILSDIN